MFRSIALSAICAISVSGCLEMSEAERTQGLPTGVALENFAPKFPIGIAQDSDQLGVAPSIVKGRLAQYARQCIDGKVTETQRRTEGMGMPVGGRLLLSYRASISNEDGIDRLIIAQQPSGAVLTTEAGRQSNVQLSMQILSDGAGGTTLKTTRNRTFGDLYTAAIAWANGSSTSCPGIFGS